MEQKTMSARKDAFIPHLTDAPPLVASVLQNDPALLTELLENGEDPQQHDAWGNTPLVIATAHNKVGMVRILLSHSASPTTDGPNGLSALAVAKALRNRGLLKLFATA